jgi:glycosyltransferase involved in cell wall biosynthesis
VPSLEEFVGHGGHFILVSRLLPYKNVEQAVEAFRDLPEMRLLIVGAGPLKATLMSSLPPNVRLASHLPDSQMRWAYSSAQAVLAPSYEDFGITPLEGAAWGKPTIALRAGGYLDTIVEGTTGAFIESPTVVDIREAVQGFRADDWSESAIKAHAELFSEARFQEGLRSHVSRFLENRALE